MNSLLTGVYRYLVSDIHSSFRAINSSGKLYCTNIVTIRESHM